MSPCGTNELSLYTQNPSLSTGLLTSVLLIIITITSSNPLCPSLKKCAYNFTIYNFGCTSLITITIWDVQA